MSTEADRHTSVETAISEVLGAERNALEQIALCEDRADRVLRDARKVVRAMVRRTQERISRLHAGCADRTRSIAAAMEADAAAEAERSLPGDSENEILLQAVVDAARILTEPDESDVG